LATSNLPKLYIASIDNKPIYVGITKQRIRNRLRFGWKAKGDAGYYGYAWRHGHTTAVLDVWCHINAMERNERDIETVEAEVVYLIRAAGQWPDSRCRPMASISDGNSFLSVLAATSRGCCRHHEPLSALTGQWPASSITSHIRVMSKVERKSSEFRQTDVNDSRQTFGRLDILLKRSKLY
jgi:hypothetical protein